MAEGANPGLQLVDGAEEPLDSGLADGAEREPPRRLALEETLPEVRLSAPDPLHRILDRAYQGFLEAVVFSSVWIAAGLASLTLFTAHVLGLPFDLRPFLLVFFSGLFIYTLDHVSDTKVEGMPDDYAEQFFRRSCPTAPSSGTRSSVS